MRPAMTPLRVTCILFALSIAVVPTAAAQATGVTYGEKMPWGDEWCYEYTTEHQGESDKCVFSEDMEDSPSESALPMEGRISPEYAAGVFVLGHGICASVGGSGGMDASLQCSTGGVCRLLKEQFCAIHENTEIFGSTHVLLP